MRMRGMIFLMALAALGMVACEKDGMDTITPDNPKDLTTVNFVMDASALGHNGVTRAVAPSTYANTGFTIYAFRQQDEGPDYICNQIIEGAAMTYDPTGKTLTGSARIPTGTYRFVSSYGLVNPSNVGMPVMVGQTLTDNLGFTHKNTGGTPEIFLSEGKTEDLMTYDLGLTSVANQTVSVALKRAVARIDVMFIKAVKNSSGYTEEAYGSGENVFGGKKLQQVQLRLTGLNDKMNFLGARLGTSTLDADIDIQNPDANKVIGNSTKTSVVGSDGYNSYDAIAEGDIINGAAHLTSPYVFPGNDATETTGLEIYIKPENEIGRTITIADKLPLERNKVTLVKVYVLEGNVFTTKVNFEITVETAWNGTNNATGEVN